MDPLCIRTSRVSRPEWRGCCLSIGNFDGVHLGHAALLSSLRPLADRHGARAVVLTFDPHPAQLVSDKPLLRLLPVEDRVRMLLTRGADAVWLARFDTALAQLTAEEFVRQILVERLGIRGLVVGPDFRFGAGRAGDCALLSRLAPGAGFELEAVSPVLVNGIRVSSSAIRTALAEGRVADAARLLGRPYRLKGTVRHGQRIGTRIGFPTANIAPSGEVLIPANGVYVIRARVGDDPASARPLDGVASVGTRPTFADAAGSAPVTVEAHLFDVREELYDRAAAIEFLHRLRDERRFDSPEALVHQIRVDVAAAREFLNTKAG